MTPDSRGRTTRSTQHGFSNNTLPHGAPPPSTLAAQIVENISSTSRKSHLSDASTEELKHLQSLVENYNAKSEDIKTPAEQVEYNHLLVYMIGSVSLKVLYWDDPFSTQEKLHEGAIAAFGFLRTTLTETPSVLKCATDGTKYLNMGEEPLWLWICPRLLKILAHRRARAITGQVEALFDYILELVEDNVGIWDLGLPLMQYFRATLDSKPTSDVLGYWRTSPLTFH